MADNLFQGLPPPSAPPPPEAAQPSNPVKIAPPPAPAPAPALKSTLKSALKSSLKRETPPEPHNEEPPQRRLRFRTTEDATETQILEAMQKIALHIKSPSKFSKASKLALQLIQAGSVKPETSDYFFAVLEAAMSSPSACTNASLRADYRALFSAAGDASECFSKQQRNQLTTWTIRAVVANDLYTDDSFVFAKAAGKIKEDISSLPPATADDDKDEETDLAKAENELTGSDSVNASPLESNKEMSDPFELDALLPSRSKADERARLKEVAASNKKAEEVESKRFIKSQREALLSCLEIAARRYRTTWAQTVIDILVKHAFDNKQRFTSHQRDAIEKLWASVWEQQTRKKQGKSVSGKLDVNAFEFLQEKYANEKISIRRAVGGGGDRKAQQWLG